MKKIITLLGLILLLTSCAEGFKGSQMSRISLGMSKADVVRQLGEPNGVGGQNNVEILHYMQDRGFWQLDYYFVRLVDGRVESYGPELSPPLKRAK